MPRGIPWDDLTLFREKKVAVALINDAADLEIEPRDFQKDAWNIGKRGAFGLVVRLSERYGIIVFSSIDFYMFLPFSLFKDGDLEEKPNN